MNQRALDCAGALARLVAAVPGLSVVAYDATRQRLKCTADSNAGACSVGAALGVPMVTVPTVGGGWTIRGDTFRDGLAVEVLGPINPPLSPIQDARIGQAIASIAVSGESTRRPRMLTAATIPIEPIAMLDEIKRGRGDDDR